MNSGADPGFQVRGRTWKNCAEWREARTFLGYFVWKITPILRQKNHIFANCGGRRENFLGISCEKSRFYTKKSRFYTKKSYFFQFLGGGRPPLDPVPGTRKFLLNIVLQPLRFFYLSLSMFMVHDLSMFQVVFNHELVWE